MEKQTFKILAFDLGRVLFDFDYYKALKKLEPKLNTSKENIVGELFYNDFANDYEKGLISTKDFFSKFNKQFSGKLDFNQFKPVWCDIFTPNNAIIELAKTLKNKYPLYLISNINELHFQWLHQ